MRFTYVHAGWEGSTHDSKVLTEALSNEGFQFPWPPEGSYYLVDSGFSIGSIFLPPHKNVRYHSKEFRGPQREPNTAQELFNYRHSSLRMVIKRTFGVWKVRFPILRNMRNFDLNRHRLIPTACCTVHNFIRMYNRSDELFQIWEGPNNTGGEAPNPGAAPVPHGRNEEAFNPRAVREMSLRRELITTQMWARHQA